MSTNETKDLKERNNEILSRYEAYLSNRDRRIKADMTQF